MKHVLWECREVNRFWQELWERNKELRINLHNIVLNLIHEKVDSVFNYICVIAKQYIYRCRCQRVLPNRIWEEIDKIQQSEFYTSKVNRKLHKHVRKWGPLQPRAEKARVIVKKENTVISS